MDFSELHGLGAKRESRKLERVEETVRILEAAGWYPPYHPVASAGTEPTCVIEGRERIMLCSNNYLGLARHPQVVAAAHATLDGHGTGPGGSRFLCGNVEVLCELDRAIAAHVGAEDAITFPTGYMANLSVFKALLDPFLGIFPYRKGQAAVIADERNHATVFDGIELTHAKRFLFRHNDLADLEAKLAEAGEGRPKLVVTEGVYSLDSEVTPLADIAALAERHGAMLMVDDAHGVGVMGAHGGGTLEHFGLEGRADLVMGSFDKAFGGMGGYLAGRKEVVRYLRAACRAYLFSSALPAVMGGAMLASIAVCRSADGAARRARLRANAAYLRSALSALGFQVLGDGSLPVLPVVIGDEGAAIAFSGRLYDLGVYLPCFRWPAVPKNTARVRVTPMATHTDEHLARIVAAFAEAADDVGVPRAA
jgi:glycine C-acetyltransferase